MRILKYVFVGVLVLAGVGIWLLMPSLKIATGYAAKNLCSCIFVGGMSEEKALAEDLGYGPISYTSSVVDYEEKLTKTTMFGMHEQTAVYRDGLGCALIHKMSAEQARRIPAPSAVDKLDSISDWPGVKDSVDHLMPEKLSELENAVDWAFTEEGEQVKNTRAVAIVYKGQLLTDRYAGGFDETSRFQGWSMTKSITAMLYGILYDNDLLDLKEPLEFLNQPEISIENLLQMSSGLDWDENYVQRSAVTRMLFESDTVALPAAEVPLAKPPGTFWEYSSGTSNLLAYGLRQWRKDPEQYINFPYDSIFRKIGAYSMVMEPDASGHFVGSSYSWATAQDWAKIGTLLANEGAWQGEQIISKEWIDWMRSEATASDGQYGGQVWLNVGGKYKNLPSDAYSMDGFNGQKVMIVPSKDLVIVRMGLTFKPGDFDFDAWFEMILNAIDE